MDIAQDFLAGTFLEGVTSFSMPSVATGISYRITVSLPFTTGDSTNRFPLLLVLDGCMLFGTAIETARIQGMTGTAKNLIVVGVSTEGSLAEHNLRRLRDYSPAGMRADDPVWDASAIGNVLKARFAAAGPQLDQAIGGAAAFQSFLTDELLPKLFTQYPIAQDDLGLAGHSMGGAFASHALLTGPPFQKFMMGSFGVELYGETPSALERDVARRALRPARQVFSGVGGAELADPLIRDHMGSGMEMLIRLQKAAPESIQLISQVFPDETHGALMAHILASGVRALWPSGMTYMEALPGRMGGKAKYDGCTIEC